MGQSTSGETKNESNDALKSLALAKNHPRQYISKGNDKSNSYRSAQSLGVSRFYRPITA